MKLREPVIKHHAQKDKESELTVEEEQQGNGSGG